MIVILRGFGLSLSLFAAVFIYAGMLIGIAVALLDLLRAAIFRLLL